MSDLAKEIHEDEQRYRRLCTRYNEHPQLNRYGRVDAYGEHASKMEDLWLADPDNHQ